MLKLFSVLLIIVPCRALIEGDMKMFYDQVVTYYGKEYASEVVESTEISLLGGTPNKRFRWPMGVLPYTIDHVDYNDVEAMSVKKILSDMDKKLGSHVTIRPKMVSDTNYVHITAKKGSGCWSYLGMIGGRQEISMGCSKLSKSTLEHEVMHALGFFHEQSRSDRDKYVKINFDNIRPGAENNFKKVTFTENYNHPYDYESVMHYSKYAFSKNRKPTIEAIDDPSKKLGNWVAMTPTDIAQVKAMYGDTSTPPPTKSPTMKPPTKSPTMKPGKMKCNRHKSFVDCKTQIDTCWWSKKRKRCKKRKNPRNI